MKPIKKNTGRPSGLIQFLLVVVVIIAGILIAVAFVKMKKPPERQEQTVLAPLVKVENEQFFEKVVRASFSNRRKTLLNSLKESNYFNRGKHKILDAFERSGIDPQRRPETLTICEFNTLCHHITSV